MMGWRVCTAIPVQCCALAWPSASRWGQRPRGLAAYAIGVELAGKLGRAFGYRHYRKAGTRPRTVGVFAATATGCAIVWPGCSTALHGVGLAASQMGGLTANFGTMAKSFNAGLAARNP